MKYIKKIQTTLSDMTGKIFNSITSSVDKTSNAPSINLMENQLDTKITKPVLEYFKWVDISGSIGQNNTSGKSVNYATNLNELGYSLDMVNQFMIAVEADTNMRIVGSTIIPKIAYSTKIGSTSGNGVFQTVYNPTGSTTYIWLAGVSFNSTTTCTIYTNERSYARLYAYVVPLASTYVSE